MKKMALIAIVFVSSIASAIETPSTEVLATVTVCPVNKGMLKKQTVTLTNTHIKFENENGDLSVQAGMPATDTQIFGVISIQRVGFLNKNFEVKFHAQDSAGLTIETLTIKSSSVESYGSEMKSKDCK